MKKLLIVFMIIALPVLSQSDDDKIWRVQTDQNLGFYMVKFSNNDSIIVGHGIYWDLFFDTYTGEELFRIYGNNEVFFLNNDNNFIRLNEDRINFEIFDTKSYQVIDSLENDGMPIDEEGYCVSKNGKYLIASIHRGFRIWDLETKQIHKTKIWQEDGILIDIDFRRIIFNCDNSRIIGQATKYYKNPDDPDQTIYTGCFELYDFETLDSLQCLGNANSFRLSNTCQYIAFKVGVKDIGVEIYRFPSMELIQRLPLNGNSLTGMEFSPDDKYLVTSPTITIWNVETGEKIYGYISGTANNIYISKSGQFITSSIGNYLYLWNTRWDTSFINTYENKNIFILAPNPSFGISELEFYQEYPDYLDISLTDITGATIKKIFSKQILSGDHKIDVDLQDQSSGVYFINVETSRFSQSFKIIVER